MKVRGSRSWHTYAQQLRNSSHQGFFKLTMILLLFAMANVILKIQTTYGDYVVNGPLESARKQQANLMIRIAEHMQQVYPIASLAPEFHCLKLGTCVNTPYTFFRLDHGGLLAGRTTGTASDTGVLTPGEAMYDINGAPCPVPPATLEYRPDLATCLFSALSEYQIQCPATGPCSEATAKVYVRISIQKHPFFIGLTKKAFRLLAPLTVEHLLNGSGFATTGVSKFGCQKENEVLVSFGPGEMQCIAITPNVEKVVKPSQYCGTSQYISGISSTGDITCANL